MSTESPQEAGHAKPVQVDAGKKPLTRELIVEVVVDVLLIAALIALSFLIERSRVGRALTLAAYEWQQGSLVSKPQKIVIVDISELMPICSDASGLVTPRQKLTEILQAIADDEPAAIGVDINFSPDENDQFVTAEDPKFFKFCSGLESRSQKHIPVWLGVSGDFGRRPAKFIGDKDFGALAASIGLCDDTRTLPLWVEYEGIRTKSFCRALAETVTTLKSTPAWVEWFAHSHFEQSCGDEPASEFLVDYGVLDSLETHDYTVRSVKPATIREMSKTEHFFRGKLVLMGDAQLNSAVDTFNVLTRIGQAPVPGVYIHACGTNTLLTGMIYELSVVGRIALDALLSLVALALVTFIRLRYGDKKVAVDRVKVLASYVVALLMVLVVGIVVARFRILWVDYYIVLFVLIAHPFIQDQVRGGLDVAAQIWQVVVSKAKPSRRAGHT